MKKILVVMCISMLAFWSCSSDSGTSLTLKNMAAGSIYLNFRGEITTVAAGKTVILSDLPKGTYSYVTTYSVPASATSSTAVGELDGEIIVKPGTEVLIFYSSTLSAEVYTIYASKTSNDNLDATDNPVFP